MLEVNLYQYMSMLRQFLPIMAKKKERCGVILVSSAAALSPQPMNLTYSAIKVAISHVAAALYEELKEEKYRVDLMCYLPGVITTNFGNGLLSHLPNKEQLQATPFNCARASIRDLGYTSATYGTALHDIINATLTLLDKHSRWCAQTIAWDTFVRANRAKRNAK